MIECRIPQAALKRGIANPYQLACAMAEAEGRKRTKKDEMLAGRMWKDGYQGSLQSIEKALQAMPGCSIGEILVYETGESGPAQKNGHRKPRRKRSRK